MAPVKLSLNDCLACSGCVTTAETMLISQQSATEFLNVLQSHVHKAVVVSLSPQSRASIAAHFNISLLEAHKKLTSLFKTLGVTAVIDTGTARDISLLEAAKEFVHRYRVSKLGSSHQEGPLASQPTRLPMFASNCPGFVCHTEKKEAALTLSHMSTARSAQQIMGALVKHYYAPRHLGLTSPGEVYHATVMPCFDKKLEASRDDFATDGVRDVDLVLSSLEILEILREKQINFLALPEIPVDRLFSSVDETDRITGVSGSSDGYIEFIFCYAAKALFGATEVELNYKDVAPKDGNCRELSFEVSGEKKLRFATAHGFAAIQRLLKRLKTQGAGFQYDFVEFEACPKGCLNGGGQIGPLPPEDPPKLLKRLQELFHNVALKSPEENELASRLYSEWLSCAPPLHSAPSALPSALHTQYHHREPSTAVVAMDW
eukprot:gnl/Hemi2/11630_TR3999_c0_g1_i1.p1 gnl/Hemi2/11630_TR3999_c0_g1~~gnl/Hemi2/11630_TR3999_c0_g1_i1.p1  ORF type:complete len:432 (+),score=96.61 gnl/Hemi2/11630_TR3999_c0_g1_i1:189-1484(+)